MAQESGITTRADDYAAWYLDVIREADLVDDAPVRGCKVLKPHGYAIWEAIQRDLDRRFKETGHVNAYFPLFIPMSFLSREARHVEGFAKECAVVTHHRLKAVPGGVAPDPESALEEPLVVRPTSETIIWHMFGRWIDSWRDLPLLVNQWANVVRWEMKTRPFLRTAEFLWQEGHTAHATADEAMEEARRMLDVYVAFAEEVLALPVIPGRKSARERFAGAEETFTIEAMMQNGWALQAGTSHYLGQNFARAFDVTFQNREGEREHVWATSWGVSTRLVGAVVMTHSDDDGLVLPPKVAPVEAVVVPVYKDATRERVTKAAHALRDALRGEVRVHLDDRDHLRPGAKYFEWERKGVPLRLEIGPRDVERGEAVARRRTGGDRFAVPLSDPLPVVRQALDDLQAELLLRARERLTNGTVTVSSDEELVEALDAGRFARVAWGGDGDDEDRVKDRTRATLRCFPFEAPPPPGTICPVTGKPAVAWAVFARSY